MTTPTTSEAGDLIEVVLVDDQVLVRSGFKMILESQPDLQIVGEADDGAACVALVRRVRPDLVLMDIQMPGVDGLEATEQIMALDDPPRVLVLTTFERTYVMRALRAGASGFLLKNAPPEQLIDAVRVVHGGDALLSPSITRQIIDRVASGAQRQAVPDQRLERLTDREHEVLRLIAEGLSNGEIAERLVVGGSTVKTHVSNVLDKLQVRDRVQAVVFAFEHGVR